MDTHTDNVIHASISIRGSSPVRDTNQTTSQPASREDYSRIHRHRNQLFNWLRKHGLSDSEMISTPVDIVLCILQCNIRWLAAEFNIDEEVTYIFVTKAFDNNCGWMEARWAFVYRKTYVTGNGIHFTLRQHNWCCINIHGWYWSPHTSSPHDALLPVVSGGQLLAASRCSGSGNCGLQR